MKQFSQPLAFHSRVWVEMMLDLIASLFKRTDQPLGARIYFLLMLKGLEKLRQKRSLISLQQTHSRERFLKSLLLRMMYFA
ncbi:MAG: hypothetical protein DWH74_00290 [Planctomycetota bacterium]|nr:MAG: hypothetical protein DWH74_00290 [Planctomycetota bacterium]